MPLAAVVVLGEALLFGPVVDTVLVLLETVTITVLMLLAVVVIVTVDNNDGAADVTAVDASDAVKSDVANAPSPTSVGVGCTMLAAGKLFALDRKRSNVLPVAGALIAPTMPALQCVARTTCEQ